MKQRLTLLLMLLVVATMTMGQVKKRTTTAKKPATSTSWKDKYEQTYSGDNEKRLYCVVLNGKKGIYDTKTQKELVPCMYDNISIIKPDLCRVEKKGMEGLYDMSLQKELVPCEFKSVYSDIADNCVKVSQDYVKYGVFDISQQKLITPLKYRDVYMGFLDSGYCLVRSGKLWGLIDRQGNELIATEYSYIGPRQTRAEDFFVVCKGGKTSDGEKTYYEYPKGGYFALFSLKKHDFVTNFEYSYIDTFDKEGLIRFYKGDPITSFRDSFTPNLYGGKWGYMDKMGKEVFAAIYDKATVFEDGVAQVTKDGVTSLLSNPLKGGSALVGGKGKSVDLQVPQTGKSDENLFAFIFANENYAHLSGADFAINDGKVFAEYCKKTIGVPEKNVRYLEDATYGNIVSAMKKMQDIADVYEGEAKIIFYFAGLGASDSQTKERYLLPSDASLASINSTGYKVSDLQKTLSGMNTTYTLAILDAPFSNVDRNGKMLAEARGVQIVPKRLAAQGKTIICMSSMDDETAYASKDYGHGLFTFGILQQLQQTKGQTAVKVLIDEATKWTRKEALNLYDKMQTPLQSVSVDMNENWQTLKF